MSSNKLAVVILAAGKGTRMKSKTPKVLHKIAGLSMIGHVLNTANELGADKIIIVIGPDMDDVREAASPNPCVIQAEQNGTADAVKAALPELKGFKGSVLVLYADVPLVSGQSLQMLIEHHEGGDLGATIMMMVPPDPTGYGRIVQNPDGTLNRIVEQADASEEEQQIRLVNSGIMVIDGEKLPEWIGEIKSANAQGEYYLTDLPKVIQEDGGSCGVVRGHFLELRGVNSRAQLAELEGFAQNVLRHDAMDRGVTLHDPHSVYFSWDTKIGKDVTVEPNVVFGPGVDIDDDVIIHAFSHIEGAKIKSGASVGPFARIRPKSILEENVSVGNFIEVNRATLKAGAKSKHVSYLGDAVIGEKTNIGAGTVIANYDGFNKNDTVIGDNVFIGSNSTLVAPVTIGDQALVAGGSVITSDVDENSIAIERAEQRIIKGGAAKYRDTKSAKKKAS